MNREARRKKKKLKKTLQKKKSQQLHKKKRKKSDALRSLVYYMNYHLKIKFQTLFTTLSMDPTDILLVPVNKLPFSCSKCVLQV